MSDSPSVLFLSCCSETRPTDIIKLILNVTELPKKIDLAEDIAGYPWRIDNKYYTADVNLVTLPKPILGSEHFVEGVQGLVLHFDSNEENALKTVDFYLAILNQYHPEIKILVTEKVSSDDEEKVMGCSRKSLLEWCVKKGFELVELEPDVDADCTELEDDFPETTGIQRIIQALNSHVWPNLTMKSFDKKPNLSNKTSPEKKDFCDLKEKLGLDECPDDLVDQDDDFSHLFSHLSLMKEKMSLMSSTVRKDAAEQVVKAFWKAMGGDDDEFQ